MPAPLPWKIVRNALGNSEIVDRAGNVVIRVVCVYNDNDGAPEAHSAIFDDDAEFIVRCCNAAQP